MLEEKGDRNLTLALKMVINQASAAPAPTEELIGVTKSTEYVSGNGAVDDATQVEAAEAGKDATTEEQPAGYLVNAEDGTFVGSTETPAKDEAAGNTARTLGSNDEAALKTRGSTDSANDVAVVCCCGFWR